MQAFFSGVESVVLELPIPPSLNGGYWGFKGHRRFLTSEAKEFQREVYYKAQAQPVRFGAANLELTIIVNFRDRRKADISNRIKGLEDALVHAGLMDDDSQIKALHVYAGPVVKGGRCTVKINVLPFKFDV